MHSWAPPGVVGSGSAVGIERRRRSPLHAYSRRVSHEEAAEGWLLVEKAALRFFPPEGETFTVDGARVCVESRPCACRGPDKPHRHWLLRLPGLVLGSRVSLVREGEGVYRSGR